MISVYWLDEDGVEHSSDLADPLPAAQTMRAVDMAEDLTSVGWSWITPEERDDVLTIRGGRDYGVRGGTGSGHDVRWLDSRTQDAVAPEGVTRGRGRSTATPGLRAGESR